MQKIKAWLESINFKECEVEELGGDASFRRYFRVRHGDESYILMDASENQEVVYPFIEISVRLLKAQVDVPRIMAQNLGAGYLLLTDLGSRHLADMLSPMSVELLYMKAIHQILKIQNADTNNLPLYDKEFLLEEMGLMQEWYLEQHLKVTPTEEEQVMLNSMLETIATEVFAQPQGVFVHRDFHSRNIMMETGRTLSVIDYQDARSGALTYDLVSLLKDVYVRFDAKKMEELALEFKMLKGVDVSDETFMRWFDFTGLQRHLKILGVFTRLDIRDKKSHYLKDLLLTLKYIDEVCQKYEELAPLGEFLKNRV